VLYSLAASTALVLGLVASTVCQLVAVLFGWRLVSAGSVPSRVFLFF
jgi:hypothetical protein